jgi:hypothetical protein
MSTDMKKNKPAYFSPAVIILLCTASGSPAYVKYVLLGCSLIMLIIAVAAHEKERKTLRQSKDNDLSS